MEARTEHWWSRAVDWVERLVFDLPTWLWLVVVAVVAFVKDGVGTATNVQLWVRIAAAFPSRPAQFPTDGNYLFGSPIGPAIAHGLHATTRHGYEALHAVMLAAALAVLVIGLHRRGGRALVGVGVTAFFASALSNILPSWIGLQDPYLLAFGSMAALFDSPILLLIAGVGLGGSQLVVGVVMAGSIALLRASQRERRLGAALLVVGFIVGAILTLAYESHVGATSGELQFIDHVGLANLLREWLTSVAALVFTFFGAWWLFLGWLGPKALTRWEQAVFGAAGIAGVALTLVGQDQTRVFALVMWPGVLWLCVQATERLPAPLLRRVTAITFLAAVAIPRLWIQGGLPVVSAWPYV